jgi:membrane-bound ClpP family serine protease
MKYELVDFVGITGVVILIVTYLLLQLNRLESNRVSYSLLNAIGALLIAFSLLFKFNLSAFVIEIFWILISLLGIYRSLRARTLKS